MKNDIERILDIVIKLDSQLRKAKDRIKVLEDKEAELFTKYYNRDQVDAVLRVLDDKIKVLQDKDLDITKGYFRAFEKDVSAAHLSNKKDIRELKDKVKDMEG